MPTILCLDLGTTMGWALFKDGKIHSGRKYCPKLEHEQEGGRFLRFRQWLTETKNKVDRIDFIYFEEVHMHNGTKAAHVYGAFWGILIGWCEHHGIEYGGVGVGRIKKHFTGNGHAKKPDMIAECVKRGYTPKDDNEADAIAMMHLALDINGLKLKEEKHD